jgi:N-acetylglucosaminyldiphosphoundecaprenol N-acetyl-beta-D-mannosaminyltransferase
MLRPATGRINVLGVGVSSINMTQALDTIRFWLQHRRREYVCVTGVHGVIESQTDPLLREIHNRAGLVTPDGMPMVWLNWWSGHREVDRVYGPDLMLELCSAPDLRSVRHFFYGSTDAVLDSLRGNLSARFPQMQIVGSYSPPFRALNAEEIQQIADRINDSQADVVWVGLSTPKQEFWMHRFRPLLNAPVLLGVGAAFDFHAGTVKQAPRWVQRAGMEWAYRLIQEPKRLWRRYMRNNPRFCLLLLGQFLGLRRYEIPEHGEPKFDQGG